MHRTLALLFAAIMIAAAAPSLAEEPTNDPHQTRVSSKPGASEESAHPRGEGGLSNSQQNHLQTQPEAIGRGRRTVALPPNPRPRPTSVPRKPMITGTWAPPRIGSKAMPTPPPGNYGVVAAADGAGGIFRDTNSDGEAWLGGNRIGVQGFGSTAGGIFRSTDFSGAATLGYGDFGIYATGNLAGGYFADPVTSSFAEVGTPGIGIRAYGTDAGGWFKDYNGSAEAKVAYGDRGIEGFGDEMGGYFEDTDGSGFAKAGIGDRGIEAFGGEMGGFFDDTDGTGYARVAYGDYGIQAFGNTAGGRFYNPNSSCYADLASGQYGISATGTSAGGEFLDGDGSGSALVGVGDRGIEAEGDEMGGHFWDSDGTGYSYVGNGNRGIVAAGNEAGGIFHDIDHSGYSNVGYGDRGIEAYGNDMGGYFEESDGTGYAHVGVGNRGIEGFGANVGGYFEDTNSSAWASAASDTHKIIGTGTVNFIQNHPYDPSSVIVYTAPEGDEVATYTRGTAILADGEARVELGETFKWVTNPDIGLTAYLTPVGEWCDLYVLEKDSDHITVRSRNRLDCAFDFLVYGLRIGFEETSPVKEKAQEAYIPSMSSHRELFARRPDLRKHSSLERFQTMVEAVTKSHDVDLSRARALRDAIAEFDPAVHELSASALRRGHRGGEVRIPRDTEIGATRDRDQPSDVDAHSTRLSTSSPGPWIPVDDDGNVYATSFRPSAADLASLLEVSEPVEPGDVLAMDPEHPGMMRRAAISADATVVGVVAASPGVVLGSRQSDGSAHASVAFSGVATCNVDATYGPVYPGDLLVTSPTPGHAMRAEVPTPGTVLGKAMEELTDGTGAVRVLVMLR